MTVLTNSFEGGTNGATVTTGNSGGASGNAFDAINSTNSTVVYDNTHAAHGSQSLKLATAATAAACNVTWSTSIGSASQVWFRLYLFITANPAANTRIWAALTSGAAVCASVQVTTTGALRFLNGAGTTVFTTTNTVPANTWVRIEGFVIGDAAVGQVELKYFATMDSSTPTETQTSAANLNTTGVIGQARYGTSVSLSNVGPYWIDEIGDSTTGYLGPAFQSGASDITATASLTGAGTRGQNAASDITATASLTGAALRTQNAASAITAAASLTGAGLRTQNALSSITATAGLVLGIPHAAASDIVAAAVITSYAPPPNTAPVLQLGPGSSVSSYLASLEQAEPETGFPVIRI